MVDACMRSLRATGFLNFRMRAMLVSYACHVLHLDWRSVMHPLGLVFLDYEPGIHVSQIQMQAGVVGINTLRVYDPDKQLREHDPAAAFTKRWVPELRPYSVEEILSHRKSPLVGYQSPVVEYHKQSKLMKDAFYQIRRSAEAREVSKEVLKSHGSRRRTRSAQRKRAKYKPSQISLFSED